MCPFCGWGPGAYFGGPWVMVVGLIFWLLVIFGIVYLIAYLLKRPSEGVSKEDTPMEILKKRFARGEIDSEEFARRKKELES